VKTTVALPASAAALAYTTRRRSGLPTVVGSGPGMLPFSNRPFFECSSLSICRTSAAGDFSVIQITSVPAGLRHKGSVMCRPHRDDRQHGYETAGMRERSAAPHG